MFVPFTSGGSMLAHLEARTEAEAWRKLAAEHPRFKTKRELQARGFIVEDMSPPPQRGAEAMSQLLTIRSQIRIVAQRWRHQYPHEKLDIAAALEALDVETATPDDVAAIIGNRSWTDLRCDECGQHERDAVVQLGETPDYESNTASVCAPCLLAALELLPDRASAEDRAKGQP